MNAVRTGYNKMWTCAGPYMTRKHLRRPGEFRHDNQHGGKLWASRRECQMTDRIAGEIFEKCYDSKKLGVEQLKQVRHSLSYSYYLKTGVVKDNWPEVKAQWVSFDLTSLPKTKRPLKPVHIPTPENVRTALTTQWTPQHPLCLADFAVRVLGTWHFHGFGLRPNVDIAKVKNSRDHFINANERYGWTEMVDGRAKLHKEKRGTRPWRAYTVCLCPGGKHQSIPDDLVLNKKGNPYEAPTWTTTCPLASMELLRHCQETDEWAPYPRWYEKKEGYGRNIGDVPTAVNDFLNLQGVRQKFDRNSGRKSLARWLAKLGIGYDESVHIHGDLEEVWRGRYQDNLHKSFYRCREQSKDADEATKALRRFARWIVQNPDEPTKPLERKEKFMAAMLRRMGGEQDIQDILAAED